MTVKWLSAGDKWPTRSFAVIPTFPCYKVQRSHPCVTAAVIDCVLMYLLFCYTVTADAVMANSGHQSLVTSVEVLPFAVGGDKLESSLLASEEGAELTAEGSVQDWILVYRFTCAQNNCFLLVYSLYLLLSSL